LAVSDARKIDNETMILNGPNLNLLGEREPHIYGTTTLSEIKKSCEQQASGLGLDLSFHITRVNWST